MMALRLGEVLCLVCSRNGVEPFELLVHKVMTRRIVRPHTKDQTASCTWRVLVDGALEFYIGHSTHPLRRAQLLRIRPARVQQPDLVSMVVPSDA